VIIGTEPAATPALPANADQTLPSLRFRFASGNSCAVTPSMRSLEGGNMAVTFAFGWETGPSKEDEAEIFQEIERMSGQKLSFTSRTRSLAESVRVQEEWLAQPKAS
jgi:hypothetical protein